MGFGAFLVILGAVLLFAVRRESSVVDIQTVGLIFMVAGAALFYFARQSTTRVHETTTVDDLSDPARPRHTVHEVVTVQDDATDTDPPRRFGRS